MATYIIEGNTILMVDCDGKHPYATAADPHKALGLMLKGWNLNEKRKYTASSRCFGAVEALTGFAWLRCKCQFCR